MYVGLFIYISEDIYEGGGNERIIKYVPMYILFMY